MPTAIGFTLPALAFCSSAGIEPNTASTSPARIARSASALLLYGMCCMSIFAASLSISIDRCVAVPLPAEP